MKKRVLTFLANPQWGMIDMVACMNAIVIGFFIGRPILSLGAVVYFALRAALGIVLIEAGYR